MCVGRSRRSRRRGRRHGRGGPAWRLRRASPLRVTYPRLHDTARHGGLVSPFRGGVSGWCVRISLPVSAHYVGTSRLGFPWGWVWVDGGAMDRSCARAGRALRSEGRRWRWVWVGGDGEDDDRKRPAGARASSPLARRRSLVSPPSSTLGRGGEKERLARHVNIVPVRRVRPFLLWTALSLSSCCAAMG